VSGRWYNSHVSFIPCKMKCVSACLPPVVWLFWKKDPKTLLIITTLYYHLAYKEKIRCTTATDWLEIIQLLFACSTFSSFLKVCLLCWGRCIAILLMMVCHSIWIWRALMNIRSGMGQAFRFVKTKRKRADARRCSSENSAMKCNVVVAVVPVMRWYLHC